MSLPEAVELTLKSLEQLVEQLTEQVAAEPTLASNPCSESNVKAVKLLKQSVRKLEKDLSKIVPDESSSNGSLSREDALKRRAERFGVVSDELKRLSDKEKLLKRKERFSSGAGSSDAIGSSGSDSVPTPPKEINVEEAKRRRLARFSMPAV